MSLEAKMYCGLLSICKSVKCYKKFALQIFDMALPKAHTQVVSQGK